MTDKEKDTAIYNEIGKYATIVAKNIWNKKLHVTVGSEITNASEFLFKKTTVATAKDFAKLVDSCGYKLNFDGLMSEEDYDEWLDSLTDEEREDNDYNPMFDIKIEVDSFRCCFSWSFVFKYLVTFQKIAGIKNTYAWKFEKPVEVEGTYLTDVEVEFDDPRKAAKLADCVKAEEENGLSWMNFVILDFGLKRGDVNFVGTDGHKIGVLTNDEASATTNRGSDIYTCLFTKDTWKKVCEHASKTEGPIRFKIYEPKESWNLYCNAVLEGTPYVSVDAHKENLSKVANWRGCMRVVDHPVMMTDLGSKLFCKYLKKNKKLQIGAEQFLIAVRKGDTKLHTLVHHDSFEDTSDVRNSFDLEEPSEETFFLNIRPEVFSSMMPKGFGVGDSKNYKNYAVEVVSQNFDLGIGMSLMFNNDDFTDEQWIDYVIDGTPLVKRVVNLPAVIYA